MKSNLSIISFMDHVFGIEFKKLLSHLGLSRFSPILSSRIFIVFIVLYFTFREGNGNPLQYPCLENHMDGGAWWAAVHGVSTSWTPLSDFTFAFHFHALEKEMATHSSILAWRIPGIAEPDGLPSLGSHRVRHD